MIPFSNGNAIYQNVAGEMQGMGLASHKEIGYELPSPIMTGYRDKENVLGATGGIEENHPRSS